MIGALVEHVIRSAAPRRYAHVCDTRMIDGVFPIMPKRRSGSSLICLVHLPTRKLFRDPLHPLLRNQRIPLCGSQSRLALHVFISVI